MIKFAANSNSKGHKSSALIKYHVSFYSSVFYDSEGELEEGETRSSHKMVKLPIKITANRDEFRSNITSFEIQGTNHFDNNIEMFWRLLCN